MFQKTNENTGTSVQTYFFKRLVPAASIAWVRSPDGCSDALVRTANVAVDAFIALDHAIDARCDFAKGAPDATACAAEVATEHTSAMLRYVAARNALSAAREALAEAEDGFYLPEPAKPAEVASDAELRAWLFRTDDARRTEALTRCAEGRHRDLLVAAARFGAPEPIAELARHVYKALQIAERPQAEAKLESDRHAILWAATLLNELGSLFDQAIPCIGASPLVTAAFTAPERTPVVDVGYLLNASVQAIPKAAA